MKKASFLLEKKTMFNTYSRFLKTYLTEVEQKPMLKHAIERFIQKTEELNTLAPDSLLGLTALKNEHLEQASRLGFSLGQAILAYAKINGLSDLKREYDYSLSDFSRIGTVELLNLLKKIQSKGQELKTELEELFSSTEQETFAQVLLELEGLLDEREDQRLDNVGTRETLHRLFAEQMELRDLLKNLMVNFKKEDSEFHAKHNEARRVHYTRSKAKPKTDEPKEPQAPTNS